MASSRRNTSREYDCVRTHMHGCLLHTYFLGEEDPDCRTQKWDGIPFLVTVLVKVRAEDALDVVRCLG